MNRITVHSTRYKGRHIEVDHVLDYEVKIDDYYFATYMTEEAAVREGIKEIDRRTQAAKSYRPSLHEDEVCPDCHLKRRDCVCKFIKYED